jgi:hypothetical protein
MLLGQAAAELGSLVLTNRWKSASTARSSDQPVAHPQARCTLGIEVTVFGRGEVEVRELREAVEAVLGCRVGVSRVAVDGFGDTAVGPSGLVPNGPPPGDGSESNSLVSGSAGGAEQRTAPGHSSTAPGHPPRPQAPERADTAYRLRAAWATAALPDARLADVAVSTLHSACGSTLRRPAWFDIRLTARPTGPPAHEAMPGEEFALSAVGHVGWSS